MAINLVVTQNQLLPEMMPWKAQQTFFVDDAYTKGLEVGKLVSIATGTAVGLEEPTIHYAGHVGATYTDLADVGIAVPALKAVGVIYNPSFRDKYGRTDDQNDETRFFPHGKREHRRIGMIPEFVWHIQDDTNTNILSYFRDKDATILVGDVVSFDDATATIVLTGDFTDEIRVEEKLRIAGTDYWAKSVTYDSVATETTVVLNEGAGDVAAEITLKSVLFDNVYLADDMTGLPFTQIPSTGRQVIGTIEGSYAIRAKLR